MKVLTAVRLAVEYNIRVRAKPNDSGVDLDSVKMS